MEGYTLETVIKECETFKVEDEYTVFSANDLIILEMAYIRGQQSQIARELAELKEVA